MSSIASLALFDVAIRTGDLCAVSTGHPGREHPTDPAAVHLPGPGGPHGVVLRLSLYPLCNVQARTGPGMLRAYTSFTTSLLTQSRVRELVLYLKFEIKLCFTTNKSN